MRIHDGFYLSGCTRLGKGEAGAVFVRYENEAEGGADAPKISQTGQHFQGNAVGESFQIWVPAPKARKISACAVVTRSSKNCYQATVFDARRIAHFKADTLDGLRRTVAQFFKEVAA